MDEKPIDQTNAPEEQEAKILVNEYGDTRDGAVVIDEADRTVLLTPDETLVIDKEPRIDIVPTNRPRKVYGGMWGPAELVTISFAMVAVFLAVLLYIFMVRPANVELEQNRVERDRLETELISARSKYGDISNTETHVEKLMSSVNAFESNFLPIEVNGRTSLYQRINGLIAGHGLVNTTGPDYAPLDRPDGNESESESGRAKYKSLYPGVYVTMTLEGPYQNLRRFIRELENGRDFVVVTAVELEPSEGEARPEAQVDQGPAVGNPNAGMGPGFPNAGVSQAAPPSRAKGKTHGETVSLRLEMASYFKRQNVVPTTQPAVEQ